VIPHLAPPPFFMRLVFHGKLIRDRENPEFFFGLENTALSHTGDARVVGGESQKNVSQLKNKRYAF